MRSANSRVRIAVIGAGLIGERHARLVHEIDALELSAVIDPAIDACGILQGENVRSFNSFAAFLESEIECDGVVIATPNQTHRGIALDCMERGLACLIEKPLAANSDDALAILEASEKTGCPVLVGHHRRHHTVSRQLKEIIDAGKLGRIVGAQLSWMLRKPDDYFAAGDWRTKSGGGPVWINLIHEVDLLRFFVGEITEVSAMLSSAVRGTEAEDTGVLNLKFENGAIASAILSDTAPSPWHFEGGSGENPNIVITKEDGLRIFGTDGAISFPSMTHWKHSTSDGHWGTEISPSSIVAMPQMSGETALTTQLQHFAAVIEKGESPLVNARDGLQSVRVVEAIHLAARTGKTETVNIN